MATRDDKIDYIQKKLDTAVDKMHDMNASLRTHMGNFETHTRQDEGMYEELKRMNNILSDNTASLKDHMYRTDLLEDYIKKVDIRFLPVERAHADKKAINTWIFTKLKFIAKLGAAAVGLGSLMVAVKFLIQFLLTL